MAMDASKATTNPYTLNRQTSKEIKAPAKRRHGDLEIDIETKQISEDPRVSKKARQGSRIDDALTPPAKTSNSFGRFLSQLNRHQIDAATGRSFQQMMDTQIAKNRPLIIARCLCNRHFKENDSQSKFTHIEFMDGNIVYEALEMQKLSSMRMNKSFGDYSPTEEQREQIQKFISRDLEFWAINPLTQTYDIIANRSTILAAKKRPNTAIEALLSCDIKPFMEEDESDHAYAFYVAGLYHRGHYVQKDQTLALKSVEIMKEAELPYSQSSALKWALDEDLEIFESLLELSLDPKDKGEQGPNTIDTVHHETSGNKQQIALDILRRLGHV